MDLTLTAEAEVQERCEDDHPREEQKYQPVMRTLKFAVVQRLFIEENNGTTTR